jgi:hypothetical protein
MEKWVKALLVFKFLPLMLPFMIQPQGLVSHRV